MTEPIIVFKDFSFQYNSQSEPTLKKINLTIQSGEKVLIVGPSGSGKSTFAHCLNGLVPNQYAGDITGEAWIAGKKLQETSLFDLSFTTGTVLQDTDGQFIGLTVAEDMAFVLENDGVALAEMREKVSRWAELVDVAEQLDKRPQDLSGGQKQRVSMAGVMIDDAPLLLFDEPLANLDPAAGKAAIELIDSLHQQTQATVVMIEHRLEDALAKPFDRIIVFNDGQIVADQTPDELLKTSILAENGIREPLYVTALKYAQVDLQRVNHLADVTQVAGAQLAEKMADWQSNLFDLETSDETAVLLEVKNLNYRYRPQDANVLKQLTTRFYQGERLSFVGKNGAGKSTLFKALCGFVRPKGTMEWQGQDIGNDSIKERADKIGYVMQNPNQMISQKMIFDEVALGLRLRHVDEKEIEQRVFHVLNVCGLYPFRNWPIAALSYGQKKRVTIAAILVLEPEMLVLDEPTAGQDFRNYSEMMAFIEELNHLGKTIVMITHDMHVMLEYSDRVLVIKDGDILADTTPIQLLTNQELVQEASLKETSLFTFAKQLGLADPIAFTRKFIQYDREVRKR
ncbi:energy-coupling factor transport system ATP-binding protein [Enterococcus sp. DIV2402]|uniref:Energy-coupling factor transport system ATP-binding protein n=1 Tax=Candidatus Enterococcus lowellii TaxID=2230877 RepID=A0ABZ2SKK5_9ENTE|nr:ABC transporter ATP-binding protein [Enterococcus sp. DIV2402]MBO0464750.1 ABC transporter ATP-binding protein [Enterococcus sp. DIV2402]